MANGFFPVEFGGSFAAPLGKNMPLGLGPREFSKNIANLSSMFYAQEVCLHVKSLDAKEVV